MKYGSGSSAVHALSDINLSIETGDFIAVTGKSGCGKSTLLNILGGIAKATDGTYIFKEENISNYSVNRLSKFRNENIGFVVQHFALIQDITVFRNISLPLRYRGIPKNDIEKKVDDLLEVLEIRDKKYAKPYELSGGQCQRVAIARAVVGNPSLLLADEPTGALDEATGLKIMEIFKELNKHGMTVILVTHDMEIAKSCNKQLYMKDGCILEEKTFN